jgi:pilus assembly protein CpaB
MMSLVLGALFAALVYRYLNDQRAKLDQARRAVGGATIEVMVADTDIPVGSVIEQSQVRLAAWPADLEPEGAIRNPEHVVGRVARVSLEKNQPIVDSKLINQGAGLLPLLINEGMRAMSVKVDQVTGVSGFITPNSRVDVLVSGTTDPDGEQEDQRSKLILQNVRVLATGKVIEQEDEKPVEVPTVTLLVSPEDAEKLTLASRQDIIRLALRSYADNDTVKTAGISRRTLFASDEKVRRPRTASGRRAPSGPSVEILLGEKLTRQPLL